MLPEYAACVAEVMEDHAYVLLWSFDKDASYRFQPEACAVPRTSRVTIAIGEEERQLAPVFVTERARIEREQCSECPCAEGVEPTGV